MNHETLRSRLFALLEMVLFGQRNVDETARLLAQRPPAQQQQFIDGVELITRNSVELAYFFCQLALPALDQIKPADWQRWLIQLLDCYHNRGLDAAIAAMQAAQQFAETLHNSDCSVAFETAHKVLQPFLAGLAGRQLTLLAAADHSYSDTETLHLPPEISRFAERADNFRLYKAMLVHQWAQRRFGSWRLDLSRRLSDFDDTDKALALFHALERLRLDACISRELPGMGREMAALRELQGEPPLTVAWQAAAARLQRPEASVKDSDELLGALYDADPEQTPPACCYQGQLRPALTEAVLQARQARDKQQLAQLLRDIIDQRKAAGVDPQQATEEHDSDQPCIGINKLEDADGPDSMRVELTLDGDAVAVSPDAQQLLGAILQDMGDIPEAYLQAAGPGQLAELAELAGADQDTPLDEEQRISYDEWDHVRGQYRKQWCQLQERELPPEWNDFVADTLDKYRSVVKQLRRSFEALRGEDRRMRKQPYGDDVDLDAVVESLADQSAGLEASDKVFIRHDRVDRDIAVLFMVDMSSSTKGWINQIEREALVLLCESLQTLGDRYAVYGFSSHSHKRCEVLRIKTFDEAYSPLVQARISGIKPREYTRMGAVIRHLSGQLQQTAARTRLLIILSDGRPDDIDGYHGSYGIEDTRQAVMEARAAGIHPFCITIDDAGKDYLPHMFGPNGFAVVDRVERLPFKVSDIYRRLTM